MRTLKLREAKASFSAVIEAAQRGEATTITKHGRPAAIVMPMDAATDRLRRNRPSFASLLMAMPVDLAVERDPSPLREADL